MFGQSYKVNVFSAKSSAVEFIAQFVLTFYWILRFSRGVARSKIIIIIRGVARSKIIIIMIIIIIIMTITMIYYNIMR